MCPFPAALCEKKGFLVLCVVSFAKERKKRKRGQEEMLDMMKFLELHKFTGVNTPRYSCFGFLAQLCNVVRLRTPSKVPRFFDSVVARAKHINTQYVYCFLFCSGALNGLGFKRTYPLHVAIQEGNFRIYKLLLKFGADSELKDHCGRVAYSV